MMNFGNTELDAIVTAYIVSVCESDDANYRIVAIVNDLDVFAVVVEHENFDGDKWHVVTMFRELDGKTQFMRKVNCIDVTTAMLHMVQMIAIERDGAQ